MRAVCAKILNISEFLIHVTRVIASCYTPLGEQLTQHLSTMAKALLRRCSEDVLATFYAAGLSPINVEKEWQKGDYVGGGAFGEVYEGTNRRTGQRVAIKVINSIAVGGLSYNTILTEMRVLKYDSEHENITKFYGAYRHKDAITEKQEIWLIMEVRRNVQLETMCSDTNDEFQLCQGGSVGDIVKFLAKNGEHLDEPIIAYILQEVIKAWKNLKIFGTCCGKGPLL